MNVATVDTDQTDEEQDDVSQRTRVQSGFSIRFAFQVPVGRGEEIPYANERFDVVIADNVLEHLRHHLIYATGANHSVVAYNFNPMHRDLNRSDYRLLWNGILNWRQLDPTGQGFLLFRYYERVAP